VDADSMSDDETDEPEDDDLLELGFQSGGEVVVCMGDDRPDCFVDWLEKLVDEFRDLYLTLEEEGCNLSALKSPCDVSEFVSVIGVELRARPWTGSLISGTWYHGWIKIGSEREVQAKARELLGRLRRAVGA
jgi:hypothetical protein